MIRADSIFEARPNQPHPHGYPLYMNAAQFPGVGYQQNHQLLMAKISEECSGKEGTKLKKDEEAGGDQDSIISYEKDLEIEQSSKKRYSNRNASKRYRAR